jgi:uncharacterized RDD family membrane protein YckC
MLNPADFKASFKVRSIQLFIDVVIINLLLWLVFYFFPSGWNLDYFWVILVLITVYFFVFELFLSKTIGMMIMNIEVIYIYGDEGIDYLQAFLRAIGRVICTLTLGIGYMLQLHDYLSETIVIRSKNSNSSTPPWAAFIIKRFRPLKQKPGK